jgi:hypothetical protein
MIFDSNGISIDSTEYFKKNYFHKFKRSGVVLEEAIKDLKPC